MKIKSLICVLLFFGTAIAIALTLGCQSGWTWGRCLDTGVTIYPPANGGEFLLPEVLSLALCISGIAIALLAYINGDPERLRISVVFLMVFITAVVGENNLMRDDIRAQFLLVLLIWLGIELLLRRDYLPIVLLGLGCVVVFAGSLGDHTMHIQFRNVFGIAISDSVLAPVQALLDNQEETTELVGWLLFLFAGFAALDFHINRYHPIRFVLLICATLILLTVGNTFLHLRNNEALESARKFGFFCSLAGVILTLASAYADQARASIAARSHYATLTLAAYLLFVFAPAVYTHEHSKTVSSWTWLVPLLAMHYFLITQRRRWLQTRQRGATTRPEADPASASAGSDANHGSHPFHGIDRSQRH